MVFHRRALVLLFGLLVGILTVVGVSFANAWSERPTVDCIVNHCEYLPLIVKEGVPQATVTPATFTVTSTTLPPNTTTTATATSGSSSPTVTNTATQTATFPATDTATATTTETATVPATATSTATNIATATNTATNTPTNTVVPTATNTATNTPTDTAVPTATNTATNTATATSTSTATNTSVPTPTPRVACTGVVGTPFPTAATTATPLASAPTNITWSTAVPTPPSYPYWITEGQSAVVNGRLYVFGGFDTVNLADFTPTRCAYVYDPGLNTWSRLPDLPKGVTHAGTTTDGRYIYIAGGYIEDTDGFGQIFSDNAVHRFDTWNWTYDQIGQLPVFRAGGQLYYLPSSVVVSGTTYPKGSLHYVAGTEWKTKDVGTHYVYDLSKTPNIWPYWKTLAPLPIPRHHAGGVVLNDKLYYIGGQEKHDGNLIPHNEVHVYNPANNTWSQLADMAPDDPTSSSYTGYRNHISHSTLAIGGNIYVFAGQEKHGVSTNTVKRYNPTTNSWSDLATMPINSYSGIAAELNGQIFYTTGRSGSSKTFRGLPNN